MVASRITSDLQPDPAKALTARAPFDQEDRRYLDLQIRGCQIHLADSLLNGAIATWARVDAASATLAKGDVVCLASSALGYPTVRLATAAALAIAGAALGVVLEAAAPGARVRIAVSGVVPPSITGLGEAAGFGRVSSAGRPERVAALAEGDYPLGAIDARGYLAMAVATGVPDDGAVTEVTATAPLSITGGPSTPNVELSCGQTAVADSVPRRDGTGILVQRLDAVGETAAVGVRIANEEPAASPAQEWSPLLVLEGRYDQGGGSTVMRVGLQAQETGSPAASLVVLLDTGAGFIAVATIGADGRVRATGGNLSGDLVAEDHVFTPEVDGFDGSNLSIGTNTDTPEVRVGHDAGAVKVYAPTTWRTAAEAVRVTVDVATGFVGVGSSFANGGAFRAANNVVALAARASDGSLLSIAVTDGSNNVYLGQQSGELGNTYLRTRTGGTLLVYNGANPLAVLDVSQLDLRVPRIAWGAGVVSPVIRQADDPTNGVTGDKLAVGGQNATGTTSTGGALELASGTGTSAAGDVVVKRGSVTHVTHSLGVAEFAVKAKLPATDPSAVREVGANAAGRLRTFVEGAARTCLTDLEPWPAPPTAPTQGTAGAVAVPRPYTLVRLDTTAVPLDPVELPAASSCPGAIVLVVICQGANEAYVGGAGAGKMNGASSATHRIDPRPGDRGSATYWSDGDSWWSS